MTLTSPLVPVPAAPVGHEYRCVTVEPYAGVCGAVVSGIDLAREHHPDLILLDLNLPDMHGVDVLTLLRADRRTKAIPVLVISADATERQIEQLLEQGADRYITKPFDLEEFLALVEDIFNGKHGGLAA